MNLVLFERRVRALLTGLVDEIGMVGRSDLRLHALTSPALEHEDLAVLADGPIRYVIDVEVRTAFVQADYGEHGYCGPADPSSTAKAAAQTLADEYGMWFIYEPFDYSSWGSFRFEGKAQS